MTSRPRWTSILVLFAFLILITTVAGVKSYTPTRLVPEVTHVIVNRIGIYLYWAALIYLFYTAFTTLFCHISVYKYALVWQLRTKDRVVRWEEVSDYYLIGSEPYAVHVIETFYGDRLVFGGPHKPFTRLKRLRDEVQKRAVNAHVRQWMNIADRQTAGEVIQLGRSRSQIAFCWLIVTALVSVAVYVFGFTPTAVLAYVDAVDPGASISVRYVVIAVLANLGFCLILGLYGRSLLRTSLHFRDKLELTEDGIKVFQPESVRRYLWQDVLCVAIQNRRPVALCQRLVLEFSDGWKYFAHPVAGTLEPLKGRLAAFVGKELQDYKPTVILDLDTYAQRWPDGKPGVGTERFSYHSRNVRAMLALYIVFSFFLLLNSNVQTPERQWIPLYLAMAAGLSSAYCFWWYRKAGVLVNDFGLTQCKPFGKTSVKWEDIQEARFTKEFIIPHLYIKGKDKTLRIWSGINRPDQLLRRIRDKGIMVEDVT